MPKSKKKRKKAQNKQTKKKRTMTSTKKALLVGINYVGTSNQLQGCHNDVDNMKAALEPLGFAVTVYKDASSDSVVSPTKANILAGLKSLVGQAVPGDEILFHFSGHGTYTFDFSGEEIDRRDECICALDKTIVDDELRPILVDGLKEGVKLVVLLDSCFSGSGVDLPIRAQLLPTMKQYRIVKESRDQRYITKNQKKAIFMISGCRDNQTSADAYEEQQYQGAMTWAFLYSLRSNQASKSTVSWIQIIVFMTQLLAGSRYTQRPQISSTDKSKFSAQFSL